MWKYRVFRYGVYSADHLIEFMNENSLTPENVKIIQDDRNHELQLFYYVKSE